MLAHVVERLKPQVGPMVINANGDPAASRASAYRRCRIRSAGSPDRSPACSPACAGRRARRREARAIVTVRPTRRSCRVISSPACARP